MITIENFEQLQFLEDVLLFNNIIDSDSYKTSHWGQYPKGTTQVVSYLESRGGQFSETVQFGYLYYLKRFFAGKVLSHEMIDVAKYLLVQHMGGIPEHFNEAGWRHIVDKHDGRLPLQIKILPEGYVVGTHNALAVVTNTDPQCYWLVNYMETQLLRAWYPISVATLSREIRKVILEYLEKSGTPARIDFMLQDFGSRGVSCREEAMIGGAANMVNFKGSDTMIAMPTLIKYYKANECPAFSVPASEHSTMTSWGRECEPDAVENMLDLYPTGIVSIVADSYNVFNFCENILGDKLKAKVLARAGKGIIVVRPDSSDGVNHTIESVFLRILNILADKFGAETNSKGYLVLPDFLRVLQGDGMNYHSVRGLFRALVEHGWSVDNVACIGMGGKLLRSVDRDTQRFAFKCCAIKVNGVWREVFKDPITDPGKKSTRGIPFVMYDPKQGFRTLTTKVDYPVFGDRLVTVFKDGEIIEDFTLAQIRENVLKDNYSIPVVGAASLRD